MTVMLHRRIVARGELELRDLGRDPRRDAGLRANAGQAGLVRASAATRASRPDLRIVCITWVFFRARTLPQALTYLACLLGLGSAPAGGDAVAAVMYTNYHAMIFALAAILVWQSPTSWVFSRRITWARRGMPLLLLLSMAFMWTQSARIRSSTSSFEMIHADSQGWPEAASATDPALSQPRPDQVGGPRRMT